MLMNKALLSCSIKRLGVKVFPEIHGKSFEHDTGTRKIVKCYVVCMLLSAFHGLRAAISSICVLNDLCNYKKKNSNEK